MKLFNRNINNVIFNNGAKISEDKLKSMGENYLFDFMKYSSELGKEFVADIIKTDEGHDLYLTEEGSTVAFMDMYDEPKSFLNVDSIHDNPVISSDDKQLYVTPDGQVTDKFIDISGFGFNELISSSLKKSLEKFYMNIDGEIELKSPIEYKDDGLRTLESNTFNSLGKNEHDPKYKEHILGNVYHTLPLDTGLKKLHKN